MAQRGGISHIHYKETKGLKVNNGQWVKSGAILTRDGNKWKPGINVGGRNNTLYALCSGRIYFTKRKATPRAKKVSTFINIRKERKQKQGGLTNYQ